MFENKTETEAREEILALVKEYCGTYHNQKRYLHPATGFPTLPGCMMRKKCAIWWIRPWNFG